MDNIANIFVCFVGVSFVLYNFVLFCITVRIWQSSKEIANAKIRFDVFVAWQDVAPERWRFPTINKPGEKGCVQYLYKHDHVAQDEPDNLEDQGTNNSAIFYFSFVDMLRFMLWKKRLKS